MKTLVYRKIDGVILTQISNVSETDVGVINLPDDEYRIPIKVINEEVQFDPVLTTEAQLKLLAELTSDIISDEVALQMPTAWPIWKENVRYERDAILQHENILYRVQQAVTSRNDQPPNMVGISYIYTPIQSEQYTELE